MADVNVSELKQMDDHNEDVLVTAVAVNQMLPINCWARVS